MEMDIHTIIEIADFLFESQLMAHIDTLDGGFYNGKITSRFQNSLVIEDRVNGPTPLAFSSIKKIDKYKERVT